MSYLGDSKRPRTTPTPPARHYDVPRLIAPTLGFYVDANRNVSDVEIAARKASAERQRNGGLGGLGALASNEKADREQVGRAQLAKTPRPAFTKPVASVTKSGTVVVPISSFSTTWNAQAAAVLAPFAGAIDALPFDNANFKIHMKNRPLDAIADLFDPIKDVVGTAIDAVIAQKGATQNFFGFPRNIKRVQAIDLKCDASTRALMLRLRTIDAFFVLYFTQPVELHVELVKAGVNFAGRAIFDVLGVETVKAETATSGDRPTASTVFQIVDAYPPRAVLFERFRVGGPFDKDVFARKNFRDPSGPPEFFKLTPAAWLVEWDKRVAAMRAAFRADGSSAAQAEAAVARNLGPRPLPVSNRSITTSTARLSGLGATGEEALLAPVAEVVTGLLGVPCEATLTGIIGAITAAIAEAIAAAAAAVAEIAFAAGTANAAVRAATGFDTAQAIAERIPGLQSGGAGTQTTGPGTALVVPAPPVVTVPPDRRRPVDDGGAGARGEGAGGPPPASSISPVLVVGGAAVGVFLLLRALK